MPDRDYRIRKTNLGYMPSDGEHLTGYVTRLQDIIKQITYGGDNKMHQEKFWCHTNPRSAYCFICDMFDMLDYLYEIISDMASDDKRNIWKCSRPTDSHDALTFRFKPHPVKR